MHLPQNGSCVCAEECGGELCEVECGENGECVKVKGESDRCECDKGYSYNGELCEMDPTTSKFFFSLITFHFDVFLLGEKT